MRVRCIAAALLFMTLAVHAQEAKYLFVNPIEAAGLDADQRTIIGGRLTEALYRTKLWSVIDHADIARLLDAQELALSGVFTEASGGTTSGSGGGASGGFVPADFVALCDASRVGESYTLTLRIRSLRDGGLFGSSVIGPLSWSDLQKRVADAVWEASSLGKRTAEGGSGSGFSLTVDADAVSASVYLNGVFRGTTPLALNDLEKEFYSLEVRKDAYAYRESFDLDRSRTVRAKLKLETGGLIVKTEPAGAIVYLGEESYSSGSLIENIPATEFLLAARKGELVWRGPLRVLPGRNVEITLSLKPAASLAVESPSEAKNRIEGVDYLESFVGGKTVLGLYPGSYRLVSVLGGKTFVSDIDLASGEARSIRVAQEPSPEEAEAQTKRTAAIAEIEKEIGALDIPALYETLSIPDIRSEGIKTGTISLVPGYSFSLFSYPESLVLPDPIHSRLRTRARAQFALGLGAQAAAAMGVAMSSTENRDAALWGYASAGILAALDLLYGFWGTVSDSQWYAEQMDLRERKRGLEMRRDRIVKGE